MPDFIRHQSKIWHNEIPGARWFRTDLHLHTLDDHNGGAKLPPNINGDVQNPDTLKAYARAFLDSAILNGIHVLGLTPHAVKTGDSDDTSAVWAIVDEWNTEKDDNGKYYRDQIYAIFPGFEPSLTAGSSGLHLSFIFDPEIGKDTYLNAFSVIMGGVTPWGNHGLNLSNTPPHEAFEKLSNLKKQCQNNWDFLCIAPHAFSNKGLINSLKAQVLAFFKHHNISALELGDNSLPSEMFDKHTYLKDGLELYNQALFHSSDAYEIKDIGKRHFLAKLATPRIESLRQSFLAHDSRLRIIYKCFDGEVPELRDDLPEVIPIKRPWLRSIKITGGASFFGGKDTSGSERSVLFNFNPDFNCIIGPRMSGKSTLMDGLRVSWGFQLPDEKNVSEDIEGRANVRFLAGNPTIDSVINSPVAISEPENIRWPAHFLSQRELQKAAQNQNKLKKLIFNLSSHHGAPLIDAETNLTKLDKELMGNLISLGDARSKLIDTQVDYDQAKQATDSLEKFSKAGLGDLQKIQNQRSWFELRRKSIDVLYELKQKFEDELKTITLPEYIDDDLKQIIINDSTDITKLIDSTQNSLDDSIKYIKQIEEILNAVITKAKEKEAKANEDLVEKLVGLNESQENLEQIRELTSISKDLKGREELLKAQRIILANLLRKQNNLRRERKIFTNKQRGSISDLAKNIDERLSGSIKIDYEPEALTQDLEAWIKNLRAGWITKWWQDRTHTITPEDILHALRNDDFYYIGMSKNVWSRFKEIINPDHLDALRAIRNGDEYKIKFRVDTTTNKYREISKLSGGQQVVVLLTLLLKTDDSIPLVIDQPEDEIDRAFLASDIIPIIKKTKGFKQIIFITHDANITVNGDADNVLCLKYISSDQGDIDVEGAIDNSNVKDEIIRVLDGGKDAFSLRRLKYGY